MIFAKHSNLEGLHAYLGASKYSWLNYSDEEVAEHYRNNLAAERGTRLHAFASEAIKLGRKQPKTNDTLSMFVNDAIGYRMQSEQILYYSPYCFGTADAISFRNNLLRISDLKTGLLTKPHFEQLEIYAALFCLEYGYKPFDLKGIELRIYLLNEVHYREPDPADIAHIMDRIITADKIISKIAEEES